MRISPGLTDDFGRVDFLVSKKFGVQNPILPALPTLIKLYGTSDNLVKYSGVLLGLAQYSLIQQSLGQYSAIQRNSAPYSEIQCCLVEYSENQVLDPVLGSFCRKSCLPSILGNEIHSIKRHTLNTVCSWLDYFRRS